MIKYICDNCKREMGKGLVVTINPFALNDYTNVSDLLKYTGTMHFCQECIERYYPCFKENKK